MKNCEKELVVVFESLIDRAAKTMSREEFVAAQKDAQKVIDDVRARQESK